MTKQKRIIIISVAILSTLIIGFGIFFGIRWFNSNKYTRIKDSLPDGGGKEATVILLGGQSNASGCSLDEYLKKNVSPEKYEQYERGIDNVYINYLSGSKSSCEFVKCSINQGEPENAFGPELGIADKLNELYPDRTFFIIKCAWGGTNLYEQWLSPSTGSKTGLLYEKFVKYVNSSLEYLESKNYEVKVEAMCWMQGESDSLSLENATGYEENLSNFIKDVRDEFKDYASCDGIAFIDAYIADNPLFWVYCDEVNASKLRVSSSSSMNSVIDTVAMGLTCTEEPEGNPDVAHYDSLSELRLGHAFAKESAKYFD